MKNRWITDTNPFVTWKVNLELDINHPEKILGWLQKVLSAGEETAIYRVRKAPKVGYTFEKNGFIGNFLTQRFKQTKIVDLFDFADTNFSLGINNRPEITGCISYFGWQGQLVEAEEEDLGELLLSLRMADREEFSTFMRKCNLVDIFPGQSINFNDSGDPFWLKGRVELNITLYSDIWFPWVYGMMEPGYNIEKRYSNHQLAESHTPRLNRFLCMIREATISIGGKWSLVSDTNSTLRTCLFMLDDSGIKLGVPLPNNETENF